MTQRVLVAGPDGLRMVEVAEISTEFIKDIIGTGASASWMECVYNRFHDPKITIWVNEEGAIYGLPAYLELTTTGEHLCGHLMICSSKDGDTDGLTPEQIDIVMQQTKVLPGAWTVLEQEPVVTAFATSDELFAEMDSRRLALHEATRPRR